MATYNPKRKINSAGTLEEINFQAKYDGDGNEIVATYATKEELGQTESVANSAAQEASSAFNMASSAANEASSASSLANEAKTAADGASSQVASMQTEVSDLNSRVTALENGGGGGGETNVINLQQYFPAGIDVPLSSAIPNNPGKRVCLIHAVSAYGAYILISADRNIIANNVLEADFSVLSDGTVMSIKTVESTDGAYKVNNYINTMLPTLGSVVVRNAGTVQLPVSVNVYYV